MTTRSPRVLHHSGGPALGRLFVTPTAVHEWRRLGLTAFAQDGWSSVPRFVLKRSSLDAEIDGAETSGRDRGWEEVGESKLIELLRKQRRRIERVPVDWDALYGLEASPSFRCRVLDVSIAGARLELVEDPGGELGLVHVELRAPELDANGLMVRAQVRNVASSNEPRVIGVEFLDTTNRARLALGEFIARYS